MPPPLVLDLAADGVPVTVTFQVLGFSTQVFSDAASVRHTVNMQAPQWRKARTALRLGKNRLTKTHKSLLWAVTAADTEVGTAWCLKEQFRDLYRKVAPSNAPRYLRPWIDEAKSCGIIAFVQLARMIDRKSKATCAAIELGSRMLSSRESTPRSG